MQLASLILFLATVCNGQNITSDINQIANSENFKEVIKSVTTVKDVIENFQNNGTSMADVIKLLRSIKVIGSAIYEQVTFLQNITKGLKAENQLQFLQDQFALINDKLDSLDHQFNDIANSIDWTTIRVNLLEYESSINALSEKLLMYTNAPKGTTQIFEAIFTEAYYQNYDDAPLKLFNSIMNQNSIFQEDLIDVARRYFRNDYDSIVRFTGFLVRLIQKGVNVQIAYLTIDGKTDLIEKLQRQWAERTNDIEKRLIGLDEVVRAAWFPQHKSDVDLFVREHDSLSNKVMSASIYKFLSKKFHWRQWFVLVHTYTKNNDKDRFYENCNGTQKLNIGGKVVLVNSVPNEKNLRIKLESFYANIPTSLGKWAAYEKIAERLYRMTNSTCDEYTFRGAFEAKAEVEINASEGHHFTKDVSVTRYFHSTAKKYVLVVFD